MRLTLLARGALLRFEYQLGLSVRSLFFPVFLLMAFSVEAALIDRSGGFIYDDVLDVTWTQNANINGYATWDDQVAWADSLSIYDSVRDITWSDWRLASSDSNEDGAFIDCSSASELDCRDNELGYMYYQNGITSSASGPFTNMVHIAYWSGSEWPDGLCCEAGSGEEWASFFRFGTGADYGAAKTNALPAWAVMDGDVAASVVPVPAAVWLFGSALAGLGWLRRRQAA